MPGDGRPTLLLVDDQPSNLHVLREILQEDYQLLFARSGTRALDLARQENPDLILLDMMMPDISGSEVCLQLQGDPQTRFIPVIFVTALESVDDEASGLGAGAVDYITKPVHPAVVRLRVKTHLSLVRTEELARSRLEIIYRLGRAAEYKDNETGLHVVRMSHYAAILTRAAGFSAAEAEDLLNAAPMHDVGKLGIPDSILRKSGPLNAQEWAVMREHTTIGAEIIGEHPDSNLLSMARRIALSHHEKWDGSGYPQGLAGDEIPIEARIIAIADVFDALTSKRPYKEAWTAEAAIELIRSEQGRHFDPDLVPRFIQQLDEILEIKSRWAESG